LSDPRNVEGRKRTGATSLGELLESVGTGVLRLQTPGSGAEVDVESVVMHDPLDELLDHRSAILLLIGVRLGDPRTGDLLSTAAERGFAAAVVKCHGDDIEELLTHAIRANICLLTTPDDLSWMQLDGILLTVLGARGAVEATSPADGDELFAIANGISAQIGGSVTIEGLDKSVLAYSTSATQRIDAIREKGILDRQVPEADRNATQYLAVLAADGCVRFPPTDMEYARAAISIKVGDRPLGTIWAIEDVNGLDSDGERALREGARLAALKMLHSHAGTRSELRRREPALLRALDGSLPPAEIDFRLSRQPGDQVTLVGFATTADASGREPLITHVANVLAQHISAYRPDASMATTAQAVYVMLTAADSAGAKRFTIGALNALRSPFPDQVRAGIGASSRKIEELPKMRRECDEVLRVLTVQPDLPPVAMLNDVSLEILLGHIDQKIALEPGLRHLGVDAMTRHDIDQKTEYSSSVTAWIQSLGDITAAARSLEIHPNTLRYRLRRASELFDLDLVDSDERLEIWLHLRGKFQIGTTGAAEPTN